MNVLWFAFGIYIIGVSALLILQPKMMFENQVWKEFGLHNTTKATIFPVWMFIILWSFLSYGAASIVVTMISNLASGAYEYKHTPLINAPAVNTSLANTPLVNAPVANAPSFQSQLSKQLSQLQEQVSSLLESPEPATPEPAEVPPIPRNSMPYHRRRLRRRHAKPGYYIRNDSREDGPKYIYYGEEPPQ